MQTIRLEVEDSKLEVVLTIIKNLKDNVIKRYEIIGQIEEVKQFNALSQSKLNSVWDNLEDSDYDRFLKV
ncbi:MAG: hypothetical protein ACXWB0_00405 [Sulfuricurvum sp.]